MSNLALIIFCLVGNAAVLLVIGGLISEVKLLRGELSCLGAQIKVGLKPCQVEDAGMCPAEERPFIRPDAAPEDRWMP